MDLQSYVDAFLIAAKANLGQLLLGLVTVFGGIGTALITVRGVTGANRVNRDRLEFDKTSKQDDRRVTEVKAAEDHRLSENQLIYERQKEIYEQTQKLIGSLERRIETQQREMHEEREQWKDEVRGLRRTVMTLERRVAQLVRAFIEATGREPPPPAQIDDGLENLPPLKKTLSPPDA